MANTRRRIKYRRAFKQLLGEERKKQDRQAEYSNEASNQVVSRADR